MDTVDNRYQQKARNRSDIIHHKSIDNMDMRVKRIFSFFFKLTLRATASFQEGVKWPLFSVICYLFYCIVNKRAKGNVRKLLLNGYLELNRI